MHETTDLQDKILKLEKKLRTELDSFSDIEKKALLIAIIDYVDQKKDSIKMMEEEKPKFTPIRIILVTIGILICPVILYALFIWVSLLVE